eukprot:gb/GECG01006436.1/.p1 GENE.gb/GECG01006436.1/~~gb/GECG01006436.1/.p1  ORF type:complete len:686 (+),score=159.41 gb/GECG01006436.1/:1-2058(+)
MGACNSKKAVSPDNQPEQRKDTGKEQSSTTPAHQPVNNTDADENQEQDQSQKEEVQNEGQPIPAKGRRWSSTQEMESQDAGQAAIQSEVEEAAQGGITKILKLMRDKSEDPSYQWWCCDAIIGLCAGDEDKRAELYSQKGVGDVLNAMKLFQWDENVQMKASSVLQAMSSDYGEQIGKAGGVAAVLEAMKSCADSYQVQVSGLKALQGLADHSRENLLRARALKGLDVLNDTLDNHPEDGQLQYRGQHLVGMLQSLSEEEMERLDSLTGSRSNPWSKLRVAVFAGKAKEIAMGNIPGMHGISGQVANALQEKGVEAVLDMLVYRMASTEACHWCLDALATEAHQSEEIRQRIVNYDGIKKSRVAARRHIWSDDVQFKAFWLWAALSADYPKELGENNIIDAIVEGMVKCETDYLTQSQAVKALQGILRLEMNRVRAVRLGTTKRIFHALENNIDDGELQWRGMQLLEGLERGSSANIREKVVSRTQSGAGMAAMRSEARERVRDTSSRHSNRSDEMAEQVDEDNLDDLVDDGGNRVEEAEEIPAADHQQNDDDGNEDNSGNNENVETTDNAEGDGNPGDALGETKTGDAEDDVGDAAGQEQEGAESEEEEEADALGETKTDEDRKNDETTDETKASDGEQDEGEENDAANTDEGDQGADSASKQDDENTNQEAAQEEGAPTSQDE